MSGESLFEGIAAGDLETVQALLAQDSSIVSLRASNDQLFENIPHWLYAGDTPLHLASAALQPEIVMALLEAGGDAATVNRRGATALHYACDPRPRLGVWDPAKQVRIIDLLVRAGAPVNLPDRGGATPLHLAMNGSGASGTADTQEEQQQIIAALTERGAS